MKQRLISWTGLLCVFLLAAMMLSLITGCGEGKPTFMSFTRKDGASIEKMKPIIDDLEKKYKDKVIFKDIEMDDPANKGLVEKYHVQTSPTYVILNAEGKAKETYMGAAHEETLVRSIEEVLPPESRTKTAPSSATTP